MRPALKRALGSWALATWAVPAAAGTIAGDHSAEARAPAGAPAGAASARLWRGCPARAPIPARAYPTSACPGARKHAAARQAADPQVSRARRLAERDSARAHDRARRLQAGFERRRLHRSPRASGGSRRCDEVVGRLCVWHGDEPDSLPPEPVAVGAARAGLLADLDSLAGLAPGDHWIFGQRIRYMAEAGHLAAAARLARACGLPEPWRCTAYLGFVHHEAGDAQSAEAAFRAALATMPAGRAAQWADPSPVLDPGLRRWLESRPDSAAAAAHLWTLADPLFLSKGNERWAGHLSRWTYAMSAERSWSPHQMRWGDDLTEVVVRYGWPAAWEQSWPSAGEATGAAVGREPPGARRAFPPRAVLEPGLGRAEPWPPPSAGGQAIYVPPFLDSIGVLAAQVGRFWRPGGVLVVAAAEVPDLPVPKRESPAGAGMEQATLDAGRAGSGRPVPAAMAGLFLARDGEIAMEAWRAARPGTTVRFASSAPVRGAGVVSVETWIPAGRVAHRVRVGMALPALVPGLLAMSDLALLEASAEPRDALEAAGALRTGAAYRGADSINLAFEVYGAGGTQATVSFAAWVESREGLLTRLARRLGLAGPRRAAFVEWAEPGPPASAPLFRTLRIRLPALAPGAYRLTVEASAQGKLPARRSRRFTVDSPARRRKNWRAQPSVAKLPRRRAVRPPVGSQPGPPSRPTKENPVKTRFAVAVVSVLASAPSTAAPQLSQLPAGAEYGSHAVGLAAGFAVDSRHRFDPWNAHYGRAPYRAMLRRVEASGQRRAVAFHLWYPAAPAPGGERLVGLRSPFPAASGRRAVYPDLFFQDSAAAAAAVAGELEAGMIHSADEGELDLGVHQAAVSRLAATMVGQPLGAWWNARPADGAFPLVLLAHGLGGNSAMWASLGEFLASHGYVVAAPTFVSDGSPALVFHDEDSPYADRASPAELRRAYGLLAGEPKVVPYFYRFLFGREVGEGPGSLDVVDVGSVSLVPGGVERATTMMRNLFRQRVSDFGLLLGTVRLLGEERGTCSVALSSMGATSAARDLCGLLEGRLDDRPAGAAGHSLGSMTAQLAANHLPGVAAAAGFNNGPPFTWTPEEMLGGREAEDGLPGGIEKPLLLMIGDEDAFVQSVFVGLFQSMVSRAGGDPAAAFPLAPERALPERDDNPQPVALSTWRRAGAARMLVTVRDVDHGILVVDLPRVFSWTAFQRGEAAFGFAPMRRRKPTGTDALARSPAPGEPFDLLGWASAGASGEVYMPHVVRDWYLHAWFDWHLKDDEEARARLAGDDPFGGMTHARKDLSRP